MNYTKPLSETETIEDGIARLKETVKIRDSMGGAMYFNILNDDCCELASQLVRRGANREEIHDILGKENAK